MRVKSVIGIEQSADFYFLEPSLGILLPGRFHLADLMRECGILQTRFFLNYSDPLMNFRLRLRLDSLLDFLFRRTLSDEAQALGRNDRPHAPGTGPAE